MYTLDCTRLEITYIATKLVGILVVHDLFIGKYLMSIEILERNYESWLDI